MFHQKFNYQACVWYSRTHNHLSMLRRIFPQNTNICKIKGAGLCRLNLQDHVFWLYSFESNRICTIIITSRQHSKLRDLFFYSKIFNWGMWGIRLFILFIVSFKDLMKLQPMARNSKTSDIFSKREIAGDFAAEHCIQVIQLLDSLTLSYAPP